MNKLNQANFSFSVCASTCSLHVLRGVWQPEHPVQVGGQEAVPALLVPAQLQAVVKTVDDRHHGFEGDLGQVGCGTQSMSTQTTESAEYCK